MFVINNYISLHKSFRHFDIALQDFAELMKESRLAPCLAPQASALADKPIVTGACAWWPCNSYTRLRMYMIVLICLYTVYM